MAKVGDDGRGRAQFEGFTVTLPPEALKMEVGTGQFDVVINEGQPSERVERMMVRSLRGAQARYGAPVSVRLLALWQESRVAERITLDLRLSEFDRGPGPGNEDPSRA
jgi:hypothetical protein